MSGSPVKRFSKGLQLAQYVVYLLEDIIQYVVIIQKFAEGF